MSLGKRMIKVSQRGERQTAKELGGRRVPGSGNGDHRKGDIVTDELLIERKDTGKRSYILKADDLEKLRIQAVMADKLPVFQVAFGDNSFAIIDWHTFLLLWKKAQ